MTFSSLLRSFKPHGHIPDGGKSCAADWRAGLAILLLALALHYLPQHSYPLLMLGSMAASAVLLFACTAQPVFSTMESGRRTLRFRASGWVCSLLITDPAISAGVAVGTAIS